MEDMVLLLTVHGMRGKRCWRRIAKRGAWVKWKKDYHRLHRFTPIYTDMSNGLMRMTRKTGIGMDKVKR